MSPPEDDTPQMRTALVDLIDRVFPGHRPEFVEGLDRGIGFRVIDDRGRPRTKIVRLYRSEVGDITKQWLLRAVRTASGPGDGFPRLPLD